MVAGISATGNLTIFLYLPDSVLKASGIKSATDGLVPERISHGFEQWFLFEPNGYLVFIAILLLKAVFYRPSFFSTPRL